MTGSGMLSDSEAPMPFSHPIEVRFSDLDVMGHVNNAVMVSFMEQARYQWWRSFLGGRKFQEEGFLIVRVEVDYRLPILLGDDVRVELHCSRVGNSSFELSYRLIKGIGGELFAEGKTVQVMLDFATNRPKALLPATRDWLEAQS
jgi:acyl-CoA thioester hydrolase